MQKLTFSVFNDVKSPGQSFHKLHFLDKIASCGGGRLSTRRMGHPARGRELLRNLFLLIIENLRFRALAPGSNALLQFFCLVLNPHS